MLTRLISRVAVTCSAHFTNKYAHAWCTLAYKDTYVYKSMVHMHTHIRNSASWISDWSACEHPHVSCVTKLQSRRHRRRLVFLDISHIRDDVQVLNRCTLALQIARGDCPGRTLSHHPQPSPAPRSW